MAVTDAVPMLTRDERNLLTDLLTWRRVQASRTFKPAAGLVAKGMAEDTTPDVSTMLLVLTERGEQEAKRGG